MIIGLDASRGNVAELTGTERYAFEVISRLVHDFPQAEIRIYIREELHNRWGKLPENIRVKILKWPPQIMWSHLRLSWELFWHRPDMLFVPADTVPLVHPQKTVTTIHDVAFERFPELYRTASVQRKMGWLRPIVHATVRLMTFGRYSASERDYHRWSVRQALRSCPLILTVSEFSKQEIMDLYKVQSNRIWVTPSGLDKLKSSATSDQMNNGQPFMLYIGRLEAKKNIKNVVLAYLKYRGLVNEPIDLVLAGTPGYGWSEALAAINQPPAELGIKVLGFVSENHRRSLLQQARMMVFCSRYEGFGLPPLEEMSVGVPVLASTAGSIPEVLGDAAYLVSPDDIESISVGMKKVGHDEAVRQKLIQLGYERAKLYPWTRTAELTKQAIDYVISLPGMDKSGKISHQSDART
jgi:glycosyltransferase involved in cell wall biosynthesis